MEPIQTLDPQNTQQAFETAKMLWVAVGVLITGNLGAFAKIYFESQRDKQRREDQELRDKVQKENDSLAKLTKALEENTNALLRFEDDIQRMFTAIKLVAGKRWNSISKIISEEHPFSSRDNRRNLP